ncbi:MAG: hypothetical protein IPI66_01885 [Chitinophagaceae bacterium]|nr:hypothetical protein [Chitinophagaceae bacterium]
MKKSFFLAGFLVLSLLHQTFAAENAQPISQHQYPESRQASFGRLRTFFTSYDTAILRAIFTRVVVENVSADPNIQYMINKNRELMTILSSINPVSYNQEQMNAAD